jgi:hypothetical protein
VQDNLKAFVFSLAPLKASTVICIKLYPEQESVIVNVQMFLSINTAVLMMSTGPPAQDQ